MPLGVADTCPIWTRAPTRGVLMTPTRWKRNLFSKHCIAARVAKLSFVHVYKPFWQLYCVSFLPRLESVQFQPCQRGTNYKELRKLWYWQTL